MEFLVISFLLLLIAPTSSLSFSLSRLCSYLGPPTFLLPAPIPTCSPFIYFTDHLAGSLLSGKVENHRKESFAVVLKVHCHGCVVNNDPLKLREKLDDGKTKEPQLFSDDLAGSCRFEPPEEVQVEGKKDETPASFVLKVDMRHGCASRVPVNKLVDGELALKLMETRDRETKNTAAEKPKELVLTNFCVSVPPPVYISETKGVDCKSFDGTMDGNMMKRSSFSTNKKAEEGDDTVREKLDKKPDDLHCHGRVDVHCKSTIAVKLKEKMKRSIEKVGDKPKLGRDGGKKEGFGGGAQIGEVCWVCENGAMNRKV